MTALLLAVVCAWTNTAGRVILAEPVRIDGASVVMRGASRAERVLPLSVFPDGERARIRSVLADYVLPAGLRALRRVLADELTRAEQRHAGGVLGDEAFAAKQARVLGGWAKALSDAKLSDAEIEHWKVRLK